MLVRALLAACMAVGLSSAAMAASLTDGILGRFVGAWKISGTTRGQPAATGAEIRAQFGGAFLEMHVKDPAGRSPYEARVFFGQADDGTVVVHWLDATGGETSRTLGFGRVTDGRLDLRFDYPGGPFRDQLEYDAARDRWRLVIEEGPADRPKLFADWYFDRAKPR